MQHNGRGLISPPLDSPLTPFSISPHELHHLPAQILQASRVVYPVIRPLHGRANPQPFSHSLSSRAVAELLSLGLRKHCPPLRPPSDRPAAPFQPPQPGICCCPDLN